MSQAVNENEEDESSDEVVGPCSPCALNSQCSPGASSSDYESTLCLLMEGLHITGEETDEDESSDEVVGPGSPCALNSQCSPGASSSDYESNLCLLMEGLHISGEETDENELGGNNEALNSHVEEQDSVIQSQTQSLAISDDPQEENLGTALLTDSPKTHLWNYHLEKYFQRLGFDGFVFENITFSYECGKIVICITLHAREQEWWRMNNLLASSNDTQKENLGTALLIDSRETAPQVHHLKKCLERLPFGDVKIHEFQNPQFSCECGYRSIHGIWCAIKQLDIPKCSLVEKGAPVIEFFNMIIGKNSEDPVWLGNHHIHQIIQVLEFMDINFNLSCDIGDYHILYSYLCELKSIFDFYWVNSNGLEVLPHAEIDVLVFVLRFVSAKAKDGEFGTTLKTIWLKMEQIIWKVEQQSTSKSHKRPVKFEEDDTKETMKSFSNELRHPVTSNIIKDFNIIEELKEVGECFEKAWNIKVKLPDWFIGAGKFKDFQEYMFNLANNISIRINHPETFSAIVNTSNEFPGEHWFAVLVQLGIPQEAELTKA